MVVTKLDRLARNTKECIEVIKDLFQKGVRVHVLKAGFQLGFFYHAFLEHVWVSNVIINVDVPWFITEMPKEDEKFHVV